jgi:CubicO group peptidase (beta-lactamase class C family)
MAKRQMKASTVLLMLACIAACPAAVAVEPLAKQLAQLFGEIEGPDRPGCALGVMREGRLVRAEAHGAADLDSGALLRTDTVFNIGSISKQFTALAVLLLARQGELSIDDPVRKYVGELGVYADGVTLRHLLNHTGGLRDYVNLLLLEGHRFEQRTTREQALEVLSRQRAANAPPGTEYDYSNTGFFLLGLVVERVSGRSLAQFSRERIFEPLGMRDTGIVDGYPAQIPRLARGYSPTAHGFETDEVAWEQTGDGQVHTTIEDLARWEANFLTGRVGGPDVLRQLVEPGRLVSGKKLPYAAGLALGTYRGLPTVRHGGDWGGYRAHYLRFPEQRFAVAALCNRSDAAAPRYTASIASFYLADLLQEEETPHPVRDLGSIEDRASPAAMPAGRYRNENTGTYLALSRGGKYVTIAGERLRPRPVAERVFELGFEEIYAVFVPSGSTTPARVVVQSSPQAYSFELAPRAVARNPGALAGDYVSAEVRTTLALRGSGRALELIAGSRQLPLEAMAPNEFAGEGLPMAHDSFSLRLSADGRSFLFFTDGIRALKFERAERRNAGAAASTTGKVR